MFYKTRLDFEVGLLPASHDNKGVIPMDCATVKQGVECVFMTKKGCGFNGGTCHGIISECSGCDRAKPFQSGVYCLSVPDPKVKWRRGNCNLATHIKAAAKVEGPKLNPIKASKRAAR